MILKPIEFNIILLHFSIDFSLSLYFLSNFTDFDLFTLILTSSYSKFIVLHYRIGQAMKKKYRREMDYVYAVISEMERKLERTIRDLDDVRLIMDTLKKIREQEVDMELKIDPVEVILPITNLMIL